MTIKIVILSESSKPRSWFAIIARKCKENFHNVLDVKNSYEKRENKVLQLFLVIYYDCHASI